jgi:hypothetical protein
MKEFSIGDKVIKNPDTWIPAEFDEWGRGIGVGIVTKPPFPLYDSETDIRWPSGRCFEFEEQLLKYEENDTK